MLFGTDKNMNLFYYRLINRRAKRCNGFINDRGYRHIKNRNDQTGYSYAFWYIKEK